MVSVPKDTLAKLIVVSEINNVELEELIHTILTLLIGRTIGKVLFYFKEVQNEKYSVRSRKHYFYQ